MTYESSAIAAGRDAGYLPGGSRVGPDGNYSYVLPIDVPDGRNGMQPNLSMNYSSGGHNGYLGVGWTLGGFSEITRCGNSIAADGTTHGVGFDSSDNFCLNGTKLVMTSAGRYGDPGSEYRTERDSHAKIVALGGSRSAGPDQFLVWEKNGRRLSYKAYTATRRSSGSRGSSVVADVKFIWLLDAVLDRYGNTITYQYTTENSEETGFLYRPHRINYTGHVNGTEPHRYIEFGYTPVANRAVLQRFVNGVKVSHPGLLQQIVAYAPNPTATTWAWRYTMAYETSEVSGRPRLTSIQKCGSLGTCNEARKFEWSKPGATAQWVARVVDTGLSVKMADLRVGPLYTGRGDDAILQWIDESGAKHARLYRPSFPAPGSLVPLGEKLNLSGDDAGFTTGESLPNLSLADIDGDNRAEIIQTRQRVSEAYPYYTDPTLLCSLWLQSSRPSATSQFTMLDAGSWTECYFSAFSDMVVPTLTMGFSDMDGDAIPEWVSHTAFIRQATMETRWGPWPFAALESNHIVANPATNYDEISDIDQLCGIRLVDIDGDGKSELLGHRTNAGSTIPFVLDCNYDEVVVARDSDLASFTLTDHGYSTKYPSPASLFGDFNGDGLQDAIVPTAQFDPKKPTEAQFENIRFNTGNGFLPEQDTFAFIDITRGDSDRGVRVVDVNGDGKDDLVNFGWDRQFSVRDRYEDSAWTPTTGDGGNIYVLYSRGDGRFDRETLNLDPGTRDNAKCVESTCRARGWSASTTGDFNGDGRVDLIRLVRNGSTHNLEILEQRADFVDRLVAIKDEDSRYARESISYGTYWADVNERSETCSYPTLCIPRGIDVVKRVETSSHWTDVSSPPVVTTYYDYRKPRVDRRGRGFLGFEEFRVWEPQVPRETIYRYESTATRVVKDKRESYPFAGHPTSITVATPLLKENELGRAVSANTRIVHKKLSYKTHYPTHDYVPGIPSEPSGYEFTVPERIQTAEWEASAAISWNVPAGGSGNRDSQHVYSYALRLDSAPFRAEETYTYDDYGNLTNHFESINGGTKTWHETSYDNTPGSWLIGLPRRHRVTVEEPDPSIGSSSRVEEYFYDGLGRIDRIVTEGDGGDEVKQVRRFYHDHTYGNLKGITTTTPSASVTREQRFEYGSLIAGAPDEQIHISQVWSPMPNLALRPSTWIMMHPAYGKPLRTQNANGVLSTSRYDDLGRNRYFSDGSSEPLYTSYFPRANKGGGVNGVVVEQNLGNPPSGFGDESTALRRIKFDAAGRLIESAQRNFTSGYNVVSFEYDRLGRLSRESRPFLGTATHFTEYAYDSLGRRLSIKNPDGSARKLEHGQFLTKVWDERDNERRVAFDVNGRVVKRTELLNGAQKHTHFSYAPFNLLREVKDPAGRSMLARYDARGRQTRVEDPNGGVVRFVFDGFGSMRKQIRGDVETASNSESYSYDALGRLIDFRGPDGLSVFEWDAASNGIGKLYRQSSADGVEIRKAYDSAGRERQSRTTVGGDSYLIDYTYDEKGRLETVAYPQVAGPKRFTLKYSYNRFGYIDEVGDVTATYAPLYKVLARNASQDVMFATYGADIATLTQTNQSATGLRDRTQVTSAAGLIFDIDYDYYADGLMSRRSDSIQQRDERFRYDGMKRLSNWDLMHDGTTARDTGYAYDDVGNMTDVFEKGVLAEHYCYGQADGSVPYAVTSIRNEASCAGGAATYVYDEWGRQTSQVDTRSIIYNFRDLPRSIVKGNVTHTLSYDAFGRRVRKTGPRTTTVYVGELYEKRTSLNVHHQHVFRIPGPDGEIGQVVQTESPFGDGTRVEYTLADQQGTPAAILSGSGETVGKIVSRLNFDPYGRRINADGTPSSGATGSAPGGLGGHEYDDDLGLVNMKGRIYDAAARRFLSVDPYISSPSMSQSYNPYSYAWNSPLSHSDPTGFFTRPDPCLNYPSLCKGGPLNPVETVGNPEQTVLDLTSTVIESPAGGWIPPAAKNAANSAAGAPPPPTSSAGGGLAGSHYQGPGGGMPPPNRGNYIGAGPATAGAAAVAWATAIAAVTAAGYAVYDIWEEAQYKSSDDYEHRMMRARYLMEQIDELSGGIKRIEDTFQMMDEPISEAGQKELDMMKRRVGQMEKWLQDHNDYFNRTGQYAPERSPTERLIRRGSDIVKDLPTGN
ncbi:MAG: hypothetical protein AMXMBFR59_17730 [Rhodanobacteraceae bacterium]